jgi:hypothetical protein
MDVETNAIAMTKATTLAVVLILVLTFPFWIGLAGGVLGLIGGLFGLLTGLIAGAFGLLAALMGGILGGIGSLFSWCWSGDADTLLWCVAAAVVIAVVTRQHTRS